MKLKPLLAALATLLAAPAMAATCSGGSNWGSLGPPGLQAFGSSFSSTGSYLDCYAFSLTSAANSFGGILEFDPWLNKLDIDVQSVSLFSGGVLGGQTGSFVASDYSVGRFSFGSLSAGDYTLAVASLVSRDFGIVNKAVGYTGIIATSVASPAPEPEAFAMMLAGLTGVGMMVRRRKQT